MDQLLDRLWVGDRRDADDLLAAPVPVIEYVMNLSQFAPVPSPQVFSLWYPMDDEVFLPALMWDAVTGFIGSVLSSNLRLLVHCRLGKSRSPAACAAYLIRCGYAPVDALDMVRACRAIADPHQETWRSVLAWAHTRFGYRPYTWEPARA